MPTREEAVVNVEAKNYMTSRASHDGERQTPASGSSADTRDLLRFLPSILVRQIRENSESASAQRWREGKAPLSAAFLFVDIYGLHSLSGLLSTAAAEVLEGTKAKHQREANRQEEIMAALVSSFERLVTITLSHGGDVIKFTGDGMLVVWPFPRSGPERGPASRRAVISACRCALDLLSSLNGAQLHSDEPPPPGGAGRSAAAGAKATGAGAGASAGGGSAIGGDGVGGGGGSKAAAKAKEMMEREALRKLEQLRECSKDSSGFDTLNQGGTHLPRAGAQEPAQRVRTPLRPCALLLLLLRLLLPSRHCALSRAADSACLAT